MASGNGTTTGARTQADELTTELHTMLTSLVARAPLFADLRRRGNAEDLVQDTLIAVTRRMQRGEAIDDPFAYACTCVTNLASGPTCATRVRPPPATRRSNG